MLATLIEGASWPTRMIGQPCFAASAAAAKTVSVMVVDDSRSSLERLEAIVRQTSIGRPSGYGDPQAALAAAATTPYDTVLVDYEMPGMNGVAFIRELRRMPAFAHVPVVMLTSTEDRSVRMAALDAGATDFLWKGADELELSTRIRNFILLAKAVTRLNDQAAWLSAEVEAATRTLLAREEEMIFRLALAVEYRDNDTGGHTIRVASYSQIIAEAIGLSPSACRSIYLASPLHDIGKVAVPDAILLKPGRLDADEFDVIKGHSAIGERILGGSTSELIDLAATIAGAHHERWDGKGYPHGLSGRMIPLPARIVAVADVFDALTTQRPYKAAMPLPDAFAHIEEESGAHFDPLCVKAFLASRDAIAACHAAMP